MSNKPTYAELEKRVMELEQAEFHRNRVEKALRESETRYRSYFDLGLVGMAITSIDRRWMQFNNRLCDILGYPRVELAQKTWADLTHPDDLPASEALFNRILAGEIDTGSMDKRFIQKAERSSMPSYPFIAFERRTVPFAISCLPSTTSRSKSECKANYLRAKGD